MYKIGIRFIDTTFKHDIYELIRAFYPESEITSLKEEESSEEAFSLYFDILKEDEDWVISYRTPEKQGKRRAAILKGQSGDEKDALLLCSSNEKELQGETQDTHEKGQHLLEIRKANKDAVKYLLYEILTDLSGRTLPWGNLTGIRPVKLAMEMLDQGMTNVQIAEEMRSRYLVSREKTALSVAIANQEKEILKNIDYENGYSLYVGIPFCPSICLYCSFSSYPLKVWAKRVDDYLDALEKELRAVSGMMKDVGRTLHTIYIGGGTPTTLEPDQLRRLLRILQEEFPVASVQEFTVEAGRPDSITPEKLRALREYPVTRISVNPQTMNQETLDIIGRKHTVEDTENAFRLAREAGFDNINMDLIVGLPGEDESMVEHTLEKVREMDPDSLTVHSLAVKRAARLNIFRDQYAEMTFENNQKILDRTMHTAMEMGMSPYYLYRQKNMKGNFENVGYAKVDKAGIYNILIMEEKETIVAVGAGASTKIVMDHGKRIERIENVKDVKNYIERIDEMIERKRVGIEKYLVNREHTGDIHTKVLSYDLTTELQHAMRVSNLAYALAKELGYQESFCYQIAIAGMVHDIGKLKLQDYISGQRDPLLIEEMKYVRMHSALGYEILKNEGKYSDLVLDSVLYHHENYDGSGYPKNLSGEEIPLGARILRVCDVYTALSTDRPYRKAFSKDTVLELMIDEVKNFDMRIFLAFQRTIHREKK